MKNLILSTDSYKITHPFQYPENMTYMHDYIESRGGLYGYVKFFGLQYYLMEYLTKRITNEMIDEAKEICELHGLPFFEEGWRYIVEKLDGKLPLRIRAVPEGSVVKNHNVLVTVESTDKNVPWIVGWVETLLLKVWYPITVATFSYKAKQIIKHFLEETSDNVEAEFKFKFHDFGYRGVSSEESAGIGGMAHLTNFYGTDTLNALVFARKYYNEKIAAYSVPASEHSTMTSWTQKYEKEAYENMLDKFPKGIVSIVLDSYNFFNAVENIIGKDLREKILARDGMVTIRPDSGDAITNILFALESLEKNFGYTINSKGYKVINKVRILQGDGINEDTIWDIYKSLRDNKYSAENVTLGCGGSLLQGNEKSSINRDTHKFAMKCSCIKIGNEVRDVYKNPVTDKGKVSKKGRLDLIKNKNGEFETVNISDLPENQYHEDSVMECVFENGKILKTYTFEEVRKNEDLLYNPSLIREVSK